MKPSQEYLEPNDKTRHFGGLVVHRQKSPPNLAEWAVCANSYLQNAWFYKLVLCNFRTRSIAKNNISRNFSWLLIFRSCSFKNRRELLSVAQLCSAKLLLVKLCFFVEFFDNILESLARLIRTCFINNFEKIQNSTKNFRCVELDNF